MDAHATTPRAGRWAMSLIELSIAVVILVVIIAAVMESLVSTLDVGAAQEAEDDLAAEAAKIQRVITEDLACSGWHFASTDIGDYTDNAISDRRLIYYPFVLQQAPQGASSPADLQRGLPALPADVAHDPATALVAPIPTGLTLGLSHLVRNGNLVVLPSVPAHLGGDAGDPANPADGDFGRYFHGLPGFGDAERQRYQTSFHARSQELVFLKALSTDWAADPEQQDYPVLDFTGPSEAWRRIAPSGPNAGTALFEDDPWNLYQHDALGILRMSDWDVKLTASDVRKGFRDSSDPLTPFEVAQGIPARTTRIDDIVLRGGWLAQPGGTLEIRPRWETKTATPRWNDDHLSWDELREYTYAVVPSTVGLGRLVRAYTIRAIDAAAVPPSGTGLGASLGWNAQTQTALIVDKIISDDVVRVVFDTCRSVADRSLALNEVRVRLFLARPSSRRSEVVLSRIATFSVILRTNNNATANELNASILGGDMTQNPVGIDFPY